MKKVISSMIVFLIIAMTFFESFANSYLYSDLGYENSCYNPVMRLSGEGILNGYEDQTFRPSKNVSRAEFSKIIVLMLDKEEDAKKQSAISRFDDVNSVKWCIPYINYLTSNNIINGYADGTFKPNNTITYAEALTILLKVLGYSEEEVGYSWPSNYVNKAKALDIIENSEMNVNRLVTRGDMAIMVDTAFYTYLKNDGGVSPVRATKNYTADDKYLEGILIDYNNLKVYKENRSASVSDIKVNDVIYYNKTTNTMDVYNKKITGIYTDALPNKTHIERINVGGNIYEINKRVSKASIDASRGSFEIGERVTLLLGENDEVCFAVELNGVGLTDYGVVMNTYTNTSQTGSNKGNTQTITSILMGDGKTYEYETDKNYSNYIGELVKVSYNNGKIELYNVDSEDAYGKIDKENRTIGNRQVLKDVVIFNRISEKDSNTPQVEVLNFDALNISSIDASQHIKTVSANAFGDIGVMYLSNLPMEYKYGLIIKQQSGEASGKYSYKIFTDSNVGEYASDIKYTISGAVGFKMSQNKIVDMKQLYKLATSSELAAVEGGRIKIGNTIYKMADDVEIINITDISKYKTMSIDELASSKVSRIEIYSERSDTLSAVVRLVAVEIK